MPSCPRPDKYPHDRKWKAEEEWRTLGSPPDAEVYLCQCGKYHVGRPSLEIRMRRSLGDKPRSGKRSRRKR